MPHCTLKSFPAVIEHTIQWARDKVTLLCSPIPVHSDVGLSLSSSRGRIGVDMEIYEYCIVLWLFDHTGGRRFKKV